MTPLDIIKPHLGENPEHHPAHIDLQQFMEKRLLVEFEVEHNPGNESHHQSILENYLRGKGVNLKDGTIMV